jgi:hypothetical protein
MARQQSLRAILRPPPPDSPDYPGFSRPAEPDIPDNRERVQPLPMYGILVAITVMNCTLASSGRLAM